MLVMTAKDCESSQTSKWYTLKWLNDEVYVMCIYQKKLKEGNADDMDLKTLC